MPESYGTPQSEARALLPLLQRPHETVESVCALIRVTPKNAEDLRTSERHAEQIIRFRARVLDFFEVYAGLKPAPELRAEEYVPVLVEKKPRPRSVPKFDRAAIMEALRSGMGTKDVARRMGCSRQIVSQVAKKNGIKLHKGMPKGPRKLSREQAALAICAVNAGESCTKVARQFGLDRQTLWKYRREHRKGRPEYASTQGTQGAIA